MNGDLQRYADALARQRDRNGVAGVRFDPVLAELEDALRGAQRRRLSASVGQSRSELAVRQMPVHAPSTVTEQEFTYEQAAEILGVCKRTVERYVADGRLRATRTGPKLVTIPQSSLQQMRRPAR